MDYENLQIKSLIFYGTTQRTQLVQPVAIASDFVAARILKASTRTFIDGIIDMYWHLPIEMISCLKDVYSIFFRTLIV